MNSNPSAEPLASVTSHPSPILPPGFDSRFAHLTAPDGRVFQVLEAAGDDWDEAATAAAYRAAAVD